MSPGTSASCARRSAHRTEWWHATFGIDLTTWSLSHLMLFYGTAIGIAGIVLLFLADMRHAGRNMSQANGVERVMLAVLLVLFAEALPWLYPVYAIGFAVFVATIVRASLGPGWALITMVGLPLERAVADAVLTSLGWPAAVIPFQYVGIGIAMLLAWAAYELHGRLIPKWAPADLNR